MLLSNKVAQEKKIINHFLRAKKIALLLVLISFLILGWHSYLSGTFNPAIIEPFITKYPMHSVGMFLLLYALTVYAAIPSLPLNLAAGFFWGGLLGGFYTTLGVTLGAWLSFSTARNLLGQPFAKQIDNKWLKKVQDEFNKHGWLFVAYARINPIVPTGPLNFLLGLTSISNKAFLLATLIFLLPSSIAVAYVGYTLKTVSFTQSLKNNDIIQITFTLSLIITCVIGLKFASKILKKP